MEGNNIKIKLTYAFISVASIGIIGVIAIVLERITG